MNICLNHLVCGPVHPSFSTWVDVDQQETLHQVAVVQLKHRIRMYWFGSERGLPVAEDVLM